jgi:hypothetical protein
MEIVIGKGLEEKGLIFPQIYGEKLLILK